MSILNTVNNWLEKKSQQPAITNEHAETAGLDPAMSKREALLTLIEEDLGEFPFSALWGEQEEGSLVKIITILNAVLLFIVLIRVFVIK